jgi:hypothetical protein
MSKLNMINMNKSNIIFTEELNLECNFSYIDGTKMCFNCDQIFFNLSKIEILFISSQIQKYQKKDVRKYYSVELDKIYNNKNILNTDNNSLLDEINKNEIHLKSKDSLPNLVNNEQKKSLEININLKKIELNLVKKENYEKTIQILMDNMNIKSLVFLNEAI